MRNLLDQAQAPAHRHEADRSSPKGNSRQEATAQGTTQNPASGHRDQIRHDRNTAKRLK
ncbi:MAG: hypothetical protein WDN69_33245 [Aliidongia sp.]